MTLFPKKKKKNKAPVAVTASTAAETLPEAEEKVEEPAADVADEAESDVDVKTEEPEAETAAPADVKGEELAAVAAAATVASQEANDELLAVLAAAVAAYEAGAYTPSLRIQKIRRAAGTRPAWATAGTNEAIDARRM